MTSSAGAAQVSDQLNQNRPASPPANLPYTPERDQVALIARLTEHASVVLFIQDMLDGHIVSINPAIYDILGYTAQQIEKMDPESLTLLSHPEDRHKTRGMAEAIAQMSDSAIIEYDLRVRHANGDWRSILVRYAVYS